MKRKFVAFPPAQSKGTTAPPTCSTTCAVKAPPPLHNRASDLLTLLSFLPERHTYSLDLMEQQSHLLCDSKTDGGNQRSAVAIKSAFEVAPGLLEVEFSIEPTLSADGEYQNYGFSTWTIRIGGQGPGADDVEGLDGNHALLAGETCAPVAVRFVAPISHTLVDDMGFLDNAIWSVFPVNIRPSLLELVNMVASHLYEPQVLTSVHGTAELAAEYKQRWATAQRHAYHKHQLAVRFKELSNHPEFLGSRIQYQNLDTSGWLVPEFVAMITNVRAALLETAGIPTAGPNTTITSLMSYNCAKVASVVHAWRTHVTEQYPGIYTFDMFTKQFCNSFIEEVALYEASALPRRRPNTMNNYGLILNDIGMYGLMSALMEMYLVPLVQLLYYEEPVAYGLDHHHSFIVQYQRSAVASAVKTKTGTDPVVASAAPTATAASTAAPPGDKGLDMHHDSSEVTVNVCLGKEGFQGGGLRFCGLAGTSTYRSLQYTLQHVIGRAVVHLGRHRHGADDLLPPDATAAGTSATGAVAVSMSTDDPSATEVTKGDTAATESATNAAGDTVGTAKDTDSGGSGAVGTVGGKVTDSVTAPANVAVDNSSAVPANAIAVVTNERLNLIMWLRSSQFRAAAAYGHIAPDGFPKIPEGEGYRPDVCCLSKFNDADYAQRLQEAVRSNGAGAQ
jgi:hypothetical protein